MHNPRHRRWNLFKRAIKIALLLGWAAFLPARDPEKIIIFPADMPSNAGALSWLSEGMAVSISAQLRGHGLTVMDRDERVQIVEGLDLPPGARLSKASMIRVAQQANADLIVMGVISGTERNLKISIRVLDVRALKLSGEMTANGPLSAMPQMENELAWLILTNTGLENADDRKNFQNLMRKVPNQAFAYYIQSIGAAGKSDQVQFLTKAVTAYRHFPEAQFELARIYFRRSDCDSASQHLAFADVEGSPRPEKEFMEGTCYMQAGQLPQAIQSYSRSLSFNRSLESLNNIGVAYLRRGDTTLALSALIEARNLARTDPTISLNLAIARHLQGNNAAARTTVEESIRAHPKNGTLQFLMGFLLRADGEEEKAVLAMSKAKSLGVNIDKIQSEAPVEWSRIFTAWER
jgi:tetratricopeptide (TPR) repeat protein